MALCRWAPELGSFLRCVPLRFLFVSTDTAWKPYRNKGQRRVMDAFQVRGYEGVPMRGWNNPTLPTGYEHAPNEQGKSV
jgi:hypothetical protein